MEINLTEALKIIKNTVKLHENDSTLPYFFIVGAGISCPEIPTAKSIVELCKEHLKKFDTDHFEIVNARLDVYSKTDMKYYSEWIRSAFPNKIDRSNFYKKLISNAKISSANLLLSQILYSNKITNTVFTTNFDDSLTKALNLIGCPHFTSENNMDNLVINNQTKDIQIIHVHGTYNFYDCANLDSEIDNIASQTGTISSSQLLSIFLSNQAPIIVGYSGWENDVIMKSLEERLKYATPLQYIWICYKYEDFQNLPNWIRTNPNIIFVIPQDNNEHLENKDFLNETPKEPVIEAKLFFNKLIAELELETPLIFSKPHIYYSNMIDSILPENEDVLHLRNWTRRMQLSTTNENEFEKIINKMEDALISNNYFEATNILLSLKEIKLNKTNLEFLYSSLIADFIDKEEIIDAFETKYNLRIAILSLIEDKINIKIDSEILLSTLLRICNFDYIQSEKEKIIDLLNRIRCISSSSPKLLEAEFLSMGLLSVCIDNIETKKELLKELLDRSTSIPNQRIASIRFNSLLNYSKLEDFSQRTIDMIEEADKLCEKFELSHLKIQIYIAKAIQISYIDDIGTLEIWLDEILSIIEHKNIPASNSQYTHLIALTSAIILNEYLTKEKKELLEEKFISFVESIPINNISNNDFYHYILCCTNILVGSTKTSVIYTYSNKVITQIFNNKSLDLFLSKNLSTALYYYFTLPDSLVPFEDKLEKLHFLKSKMEYSEIYEDLLCEIVILNDSFKEDSILKKDIEFIEEMNSRISDGLELYKNKNFSEAEKQFKIVASCGIKSLVDIAKTNLAFMIRRNETQENYNFKDVIKDIKEPNIFTILNLILYCIENEETSSDEYIQALSDLSKLDDDIYQAINWWSDTNIVGEKESTLVLRILDEKFKSNSTIDFEDIKEPIAIG